MRRRSYLTQQDTHPTISRLYKVCGLADARLAHDYIDNGPKLRNMNVRYKKDFSPEYVAMLTESMQPLLSALGYR